MPLGGRIIPQRILKWLLPEEYTFGRKPGLGTWATDQGGRMWLRAKDLGRELRKEEILDWVEIDGIVWVEILDGKGALYVQPGLKRKFSENNIPVEACLEEAND